MWARQLGEQIGVTIPNQAAEHYYLITEKIADLPPNLPVLEDPASYGYFREETGGLLVGLFEPVCAPWNVEGIPADFSFGEIPPDWERMGPYLEKAMHRVPVTLEAGHQEILLRAGKLHAGPAAHRRRGAGAARTISLPPGSTRSASSPAAAWAACSPIGSSPAIPGADVTGFNIDRMHPYQANPEYRRERTIESLGMVYKCHYPTMSPQTARGVKKSAVHDRLAAAGAYFRDVSGWEGADWYAPAGHEPKVEKLSWGRENWFRLVGGRASGRTRGRDPHGHVVHEQVPGAGARCGARAQPHLGQQRRWRAGCHHLHAVAQRARDCWRPISR